MPLRRVTDAAAAQSLSEGHDLYDLHYHTLWSDGLASARQALDLARQRRVRLAITDHNVVEGALEAARLLGDEARHWLIPGIEVTTEERIHLLLYFRKTSDLQEFFVRAVAPWRARGSGATTPIARPAADVLADARRWEHLSVAPHPFAIAKNGWMTVRERFAHIPGMISDLDGWEVLNGQELDGGNQRAAEMARKGRQVATAGSDGHTLRELGQVCTAIPRGADLFEALRSRAASIVDLRPEAAWRRLAMQGAKAPYYAKWPFRKALRWARPETADGPHTRAALRSTQRG
jgi:hypothetical protein